VGEQSVRLVLPDLPEKRKRESLPALLLQLRGDEWPGLRGKEKKGTLPAPLLNSTEEEGSARGDRTLRSSVTGKKEDAPLVTLLTGGKT